MIRRRLPSILTVCLPRPLLPDPANFHGWSTCNSCIPPTPPDLSRPYYSLISYLSQTLKASARMNLVVHGEQVHALLVKAGLCGVLSLQNQLLHAYVTRKLFLEALALLDEIPSRNVITWNTWLRAMTHSGSGLTWIFRQAIDSFRGMLMDSVNPDHLTFNSLLHGCVEFDSIEVGVQLHCFVVRYGSLANCFVGVGLICLYGKLWRMEEAKSMFDELSYKDLPVWNSLCSCYSLTGYAEEAFLLHKRMRLEGKATDEYTLSTLIGGCASTGFWELAVQLHAAVIRLGFDADVVVTSALVDAYSKSGSMEDARCAFDLVPAKNIISWNTLIIGYVHSGEQAEAMRLLRKLFRERFYPDQSTLAGLISSFGLSSSMVGVSHLHALAIKVGIMSHLSVLNSLISAYSKCGSIGSASQCFTSVEEPDIVTWSSIIAGYGFHGLATEAARTFQRMLSSGVRPDNIAFLGVISSCAHSGMVREGLYYLDLMIKKYHLTPDVEHYACLIDLAARAGLVDKVLSAITLSREVEWSTSGAIPGAYAVQQSTTLDTRTVEEIFLSEPAESANYALISNLYASEGKWGEVARLRKMMRINCGFKVPGISWIEITGTISTFVSCDKSHSETRKIYGILSLFYWESDDDKDTECSSPLNQLKYQNATDEMQQSKKSASNFLTGCSQSRGRDAAAIRECPLSFSYLAYVLESRERERKMKQKLQK